MSYLYFASIKGIVALDLERGIVINPPRPYKGKSTRAVSVHGSVAYILDTKQHLEALGVDVASMKAPKAAPPADKPAKARSYGRRYQRKAAESAPQEGE